jgi:hypothetical protein
MNWDSLHDLFVHNYSPSGRELCRYSFDALAAFMGQKGMYEDRIGALKEFVSLPKDEAQRLYDDLHMHLLSLGYKGSSIRRMLSVIYRFTETAYQQGILRWRLTPPRVDSGKKKSAGAETLAALVDCAMRRNKGGTLVYWKRNGHRNAALLHLVALGFTFEALTLVTTRDFYSVQRTIQDPTDDERRIFLPTEALSHLCAWMGYREKMQLPTSRLFVEARAPYRPLKPFAIEKIIITLEQGCEVGTFNPRILIGCLKIPKGKRLA